MIACPKCGSQEIRFHGVRQKVRWSRPLFSFQRPRLRTAVVAVDLSCGDCFYAFVSRPSGITDAPLQAAHDQLQEIRAGLKAAAAGSKTKPDEKPQGKVAVMPRLAPDPRVRKA